MAKQLEACLYRSAVSYEAYANTSTLKSRLQMLAIEISAKTEKMGSAGNSDPHPSGDSVSGGSQSRDRSYNNERKSDSTYKHRSNVTNSSQDPFMTHSKQQPLSRSSRSNGESSSTKDGRLQMVCMDQINPMMNSPTPTSGASVAGSQNGGVLSLSNTNSLQNREITERRIRNKHQRLLLLRHVSQCKVPDGQCTVTPHCTEMKRLWKHTYVCQEKDCSFPHCLSSRCVLSHYRKCKDVQCSTCRPVRETIEREKLRKKNLRQKQFFSQISSSDSHIALPIHNSGDLTSRHSPSITNDPYEQQHQQQRKKSRVVSDIARDIVDQSMEPEPTTSQGFKIGGNDNSIVDEGEKFSLFIRTDRTPHVQFNCGLCSEDIVRSGKSFGLMSSCDHCFCIDCLRTWRQSNKNYQHSIVTRVCPLCHAQSELVVPSKKFAVGSEKQKILEGYKKRPNKVKEEVDKPMICKVTPATTKHPRTKSNAETSYSLINSFPVEQIELHNKSLNRTVSLSQKDLKEKCLTILNTLKKHKDWWVFSAPVDPVELKMPDYFSIIKRPMDLGTVKKKVESSQYHSIEEFNLDVRLTFDNAMSYNEIGSVVHEMVIQIKSTFVKEYKKLMYLSAQQE